MTDDEVVGTMRRGLRCTLSAVLTLAISAGTVWSLESATRAQPVSQPAQQPATTQTDATLIAQLSALQRQLDGSARGSLTVRREILRLRALLAARRASVAVAAPGGWSAPPPASGYAGPNTPTPARPAASSPSPARTTSAPRRTPSPTPTPTSTPTDDGGGDD
ncbi:MAG TPA: hypothetical protein VFD94_09885 [Jatrophihabitans sp.]|nr:hypothetical protein [Jatrophihabitans sp.]